MTSSSKTPKSALVIMVFAWWCVLLACHPRVFVVSLEEEEMRSAASNPPSLLDARDLANKMLDKNDDEEEDVCGFEKYTA